MKANEFVRQFGISTAKNVLDNVDVSKAACFAMFTEPRIDYTELKRLVESHELVESYNGLKSAIYMRNHNMILPEFMNELKQAISDVESCK